MNQSQQPSSTRTALKEWAVVVHALLEGEQILDVRKGGLREEGRHFGVHATRLWLFHDGAAIRKAARSYVERLQSDGSPRT